MLFFYCKECDLKFEHPGVKKEYMDYVVGPCSKYMAPCPNCSIEVDEYRKPKHGKSFEPVQMAPCGKPGGCCCA